MNVNLTEEEQTPYGLHFVRSDSHAFPVRHLYSMSTTSKNLSSNETGIGNQQSAHQKDDTQGVQGRDEYMSLDSRAAHLWTQTGRERHRIGFPKSTLGYITCFTQVAKSGLLIASAINMRLIVYDRGLNFRGTIFHSERTFASICFDDKASRLITSE
jgi:hypothetical protein